MRKLDLWLRSDRILLGHAALDFNGTAYAIPDRAGDSTSMPVAGFGLDYAAAMLGDGGVDKRLSDSL